MKHEHAGHVPAAARRRDGQYARLGFMTALSFITMYVLMYAMVDSTRNVVMNLNQVYMAALMAAPMVLLELLLMRSMYDNKKLNAAIAAAAVIVAVVGFISIRKQAAIGDRQFLRSMIPHHASAILMCLQSSAQSTAIRNLCDKPDGIIASQQAEIAQMRALLDAGK